MKKASLTAIIAFTLLNSLLVAPDTVQTAKANFGPSPIDPPKISIVSPENSSVQSGPLVLVFNESNLIGWCGAPVTKIGFSCVLDSLTLDIEPVLVSSVIIGVTNLSQWSIPFWDLPKGLHNITVIGKIGPLTSTVWAGVDVGNVVGVSQHVYFTANRTPPIISVQQPENSIFNSDEIPLQFNIDRPCLQIVYSLDNQANVTVSGNMTLRGLTFGLHSIIVYASNFDDNVGKSEVVFFTVNMPPTSTTSPSPTLAPTPTPSPMPRPTPRPSLSASPSFSPSPSPTSIPIEEPTATPSPNLTKQQKDFWSTSVPVEYIFIVTAVFAAVIFIIIFLAIRNRKHKP